MFISNLGTDKIGKFWINGTNEMEDEAKEQLRNLLHLPMLHEHIAIMPNIYTGYGTPSGTIVALENAIIPVAIGPDIGCGIMCVTTNLVANTFSIQQIREIILLIKKQVPIGIGSRNKNLTLLDNYNENELTLLAKQNTDQIGTLGANSHYIELARNNSGNLCILIHSGSRYYGYFVCDKYNEIAQKQNMIYHSIVSPSWHLPFLPIGTFYFEKYFKEMKSAVKFASINREVLTNKVLEIIEKYSKTKLVTYLFDTVHNYASFENHFGKNVIIHRKGAVRIRKGQPALISGSQGSFSYIVKGLDSADSFDSCSCGVGRRFSITKARQVLDIKIEKKKLEDLGVVHSLQCSRDLGESPGAYKNIEHIIRNHENLIEIEDRLFPIACIKG